LTEIIITADNRQQIVWRYLLEFVPLLYRKTHDCGLFHLRKIYFHQCTSGNRMIQFCILHWKNLLSLVQSVNLLRPKIQPQDSWLHINDARPHSSALSLYKIEELGFTRLPQLPCSPDLAPCDFLLFGYLKKELQGMNLISQNGMISAVTVILSEIPVRTLSRVFDHWIERLHGYSTNGREYV
jgi:hypothetical protein